MGQVIRLTTAPRAYPTATVALDAAERLSLVAIRWWVAPFRHAEDPLPQLYARMAAAAVDDAALFVDAQMGLAARTARQTIDIHCPRSPNLCLLHAASLVQAGNGGIAERGLRTALLSAQGAEFALGPLEGLGEILTTAGLHFRRWRLPQDRSNIECWVPPASLELWH